MNILRILVAEEGQTSHHILPFFLLKIFHFFEYGRESDEELYCEEDLVLLLLRVVYCT
jgi:hypothetical protein